MALPNPRTYNKVALDAQTTSIATTPVAGYAIATNSGYVQRVMAASGGTTTGTITVAVTINGGSDIANSTLTIAAGSGGPGAVVELPLVGAGSTSGIYINEGDLIKWTPSGGTCASIPGAFGLVIRATV